MNIVDFNGFYNGGGVATGDFNNDGLVDLYFTSNTGKNRLYLNKGDFKFEDITESSGAGGTADWTTGVTLVDLNADGYLDIYLSVLSQYRGLLGKNQYLLNNGDLTFTDMAAIINLDVQSYGCQSAFFDYDHDGDLDCFLLNMSNDRANVQQRAELREGKNEFVGDRLYRNDNGQFKEVSEEAGIYQGEIGFGLGLTVADFNDDLWEDIYISNDFYEDDYLYINQKDGTFKESGSVFFNHYSRFSMGADAADINNDGYLDLMTLDMAPEDEIVEKSSLGQESYESYKYKLTYGYQNQYGQNTLQLNNQGKGFSDIAPLLGIEATDWSWSPLIADFDNDGVKDIFISNGIVKRPNDLDLINYLEDYAKNATPDLDLNRYYQDYYDYMPLGVVHDYIYKGHLNEAFEDKSEAWGFEEGTVSNGATYADLDNDGDLEIIVNRINRPALIYKNLSRESANLKNHKANYLKVKLSGSKLNRYGIGAKVYLKSKDSVQMQQQMLTRGFLSAISPELHFGIGNRQKIDSVFAVWPDGKTTVATHVAANTVLKLDYKKANSNTIQGKKKLQSPFQIIKNSIPFKHKENNYNDFNTDALAPFMASTEGPAISVGDINGDGLEDVFTGGASEQAAAIWQQTPSGSFEKVNMPVFEKERFYEDVDAVFFDMDNDGDNDLYVCSGGNQFSDSRIKDRLYENKGEGRFSRTEGKLPEFLINSSCVRPADYDSDGDIDLFLGGRSIPGNYGTTPKSILLENKGTHFKIREDFNNSNPYLGMITDAQWQDLDFDGDKDLIVVGEFMPITCLINENGNFSSSKINTDQPTKGLWHSVEIEDIDGDGDLDILAGNLGLNSRLIKHHGNEKLRLYVKDLDDNGKIEQLLCYQRNGAWYPVNNRDELGQVLPAIIKKRFVSNKAYAGKPITEIFTKQELKDALILETDLLASIYLENKQTEGFQVKRLPFFAQYAPIFDFGITDLNSDGYLDVLGGGNFYGVSPYQARYDASKAFYLLGGKEGFVEGKSLDLIGEIRTIKKIDTPYKNSFLVGRNNDSLLILNRSQENP
ncbi:VCBS repeat-containing protein [Maribacter sp. 2210JD10-5]|uniref:VCBS repeat-containing protein n=1 Tax=Maribacter sp. 2210JD10-5 TaxID=3386272 RepID=UPI0039BD837D